MLVLITYDVNTETAAGRARLRKVAKQCVNYGRRVQNSVFECILDNAQCVMLKSTLMEIIDEEVDSWGILWDEKYANQIMMYDSIRDSMMVALAYLGYDINTTDPEELAEAGDLLLAQKPLVRGYGADNIKYDMIGGGVALGVDYSGSAVQAIMENEDLAYVVPKEGSNVWMDNFVVLKSSPNKEAAERFINFMCDPEVSAQNSEFVGYTTPNEAALEYVDEEFTSNSAYTIPDGVLDRCAYFKDLGDALQLYNDEWMKVKTAA